MTETTEEAPDARTIATLTKRYEDKLQDIANRLADLAREVSREGKARPTVLNADGQTDYIYAAERAIHALHWGIANLNADSLIGTAAEAHNAVRGRWK
jgi:hypothetical protein